MESGRRSREEDNPARQAESDIQEISQLITGKKGMLDQNTPQELVRKTACNIAILTKTYGLTSADAIGAAEQAHEEMKRKFPWFQRLPLPQQMDLALQTTDLALAIKTKNFRH